MELFKKQNGVERVLLFGTLLGLLIAVLFGYTSASAGVAESARGFAWSSGVTSNPDGYDGMGWISMNNVSDPTGGQTVSYGVNIPSSDGDLSGYAWNNYYGWISFNGADLSGGAGGGCGPLTQAKRVGNTLTGGARIIAIRDAGTNSGGYDGCIGLSGITIAGNALSGFAWSSDLGWIDFTGVTFVGVTPPTNLTAQTDTTCNSGSINLAWNSVTNATRYVLRDGIGTIYTGPGTSFPHTGLAANSSHNYTVRAEAGAQISNWSAVVTGVAPSVCGQPSGTVNVAPSCTINIGQGTCTIPGITWSVSKPASAVSSALKQDDQTFATNPSLPAVSRPITHGTPPQNTITVTDTGSAGILATFTPEGICAVDSFWNGSICTQPNLTIQLFTIGGTAHTGAPGPFTQGVGISLAGVVRNSGTVATDPTKTFTDNFSYSWDDGVTWLPATGNSSSETTFDTSTNFVLHASLASNATANDNKIFTPDRSGNLRLQYCVDSTDVIKEGVAGEGSNCVQSAPASMPGSITVNPVGPTICVPKDNVNGERCDITAPSTPVGSSAAGTCSVGYSGSCNYTCTDASAGGSWSKNTNSCVPNPAIDLFHICDSSGANCADPKNVPAGTALKIKWSASNADTCGRFGPLPADFSTGAGSPISGTDDITANSLPGQTDIYEIICSRGASSVRDTAQVLTVAGPDISLDKRIVNVDETVRVSWKPPAGGICTVKGGGINLVGESTDNSKDVVVKAQTTFTINCGAGGSSSVRVDVIGWQAGT